MGRLMPQPKPSRWLTAEFFVYYAIILFAVYKLVYNALTLSSRTPTHNILRHMPRVFLKDGSSVDSSSFRDNMPLLTLVMLAYVVLSACFAYREAIFRLVEASLTLLLRPLTSLSSKDAAPLLTKADTLTLDLSPEASPVTIDRKLWFHCVASLVFLVGLHGSSSVFILTALLTNFVVVKRLKGAKVTVAFSWIFNLAVLLLAHWTDSLRFGHLSPALAFLDTFRGFHSRWYVLYNIVILRIISFNLDYYYSFRETQESVQKHANGCGECQQRVEGCDKARASIPLPQDQYSFRNFLAYVLYAPLYLAGPIITFNNFMHQIKYRCSTITFKRVALYGLRLLAVVLLMEFILHFFYVQAVKNNEAWATLTTMEMFSLAFWNLKCIWLKLLIIWRFARFWAMMDGIDAPENMCRCMTNNYSGMAFWRSWHRSFNQWIIRYMYVPMGGRATAVWNIWIIFTFVAVWHDRTFTLLAWGGIICIFMLPEIVGLMVAKKLNMETWQGYRFICGFFGAINVYIMSFANLIGFSVGVNGAMTILHKATPLFWLQIITCSFAAVQIEFEVREAEIRRGIYDRNY